MKPPLAERLRPQSFEDVVGQAHLDEFLKQTLERDHPLSLILWGPPGCGKTTIARLYASHFRARMVSFSAVFNGVAELRKVVNEADKTPLIPTILFVDEIHRFNKAQQDGFLPYVERGTITLVGATTENPSFALNDALLSRARVLELKPLDDGALDQLITRYEEEIESLSLTPEDRAALIEMAAGDGRYLLNLIESWPAPLQKRSALYDKRADGHFNLISALHKTVRASDADAALYWFSRMIEGGEDPLFIARRLIRMASEDIGLADPEALKLAIAARDAYQMLGAPEGHLALAQLVVYLSLAPKSRAINDAYDRACAYAAKTSHLPPPKHILNAPTRLMKELGYGKGKGSNFPEGDHTFYHPEDLGFEREMKKRLAYFSKASRLA